MLLAVTYNDGSNTRTYGESTCRMYQASVRRRYAGGDVELKFDYDGGVITDGFASLAGGRLVLEPEVAKQLGELLLAFANDENKDDEEVVNYDANETSQLSRLVRERRFIMVLIPDRGIHPVDEQEAIQSALSLDGIPDDAVSIEVDRILDRLSMGVVIAHSSFEALDLCSPTPLIVASD